MLSGYAPLNAVHRTMMDRPAPNHSRYDVVHTSAPTANVVLTQVRRQSLGQGFSEMALYVLVRRHGSWWLAAEQNTPIRAADVNSG